MRDVRRCPICENHFLVGRHRERYCSLACRYVGLREHGPRQKLDREQVASIRERHRAGVPQTQIAADLGVSKATISRILSGERWGWLEPPGPAR